jgi:hypothetical protein
MNKSSVANESVDEYHLPQMNSEKVFFWCGRKKFLSSLQKIGKRSKAQKLKITESIKSTESFKSI